MNHYVYKIEFTETGHVYFGARSCECLPKEDSRYLGSPITYKNFWEEKTPRKVILQTFETRLEANEYENILIDWCWSVNKSLSLNATIAGAKFNSQGWNRDEAFKQKVRERCQKPFKLVSPEGEIVEGINLRKFAIENNLSPSKLYTLIGGNMFYYKGWTASISAYKFLYNLLPTRGIYKSDKYWRVKWVECKESTQKYFKSLEEALIFRDSLEKTGYKFRVMLHGWKEKLKKYEK